MRLKERITAVIEHIFYDEEYGFEVYIMMKSPSILKRFQLFEGRPGERNDPEKNFKRKIQLSIAEIIKEKYLEEEKEYDTAEHAADNQDKFYVITQSEDYQPFAVVNAPLENAEGYHADERENAQGVFFRFERSGSVVWAYQFLYQNAIPNRRGIGFHIIPAEGDVFDELKKPILLLSRRVDLLVLENEIVCDKINLLQRNFGFQEFVRMTAKKVVESIQNLELVANMDKVSAYISRGRPQYAKKMMRIKDSRVLKQTAAELYRSVTTLPRWQEKFGLDEVHQKLVLNTYEQVENLIDLLDERYTRSDVTGEEYDSGNGAKKWLPAEAT